MALPRPQVVQDLLRRMEPKHGEAFLGMEDTGKAMVAEFARLRNLRGTPEFSRIRLAMEQYIPTRAGFDQGEMLNRGRRLRISSDS